MATIIKNAKVYIDGKFKQLNFAFEGGVFSKIAPTIDICSGDFVFDFSNHYIFPGFIDVHSHLREPGFFYKETILTGTKSAARGGFTTVFSMPNLNPVPDCLENLKPQLDLIKKDAVINVYPYASITKGQKGKELANFEELSDYVIAFTDDGKGVQANNVMLEAMQKAKALNKIIVAHCEDESLLFGGVIHDGKFAKEHNVKGISSKSEWAQVERDIELVRKTNANYHICHVSTKESVELIRKAKKEGLPITAETAPHYLTLTENDLIDDGRFKMNPPIREELDRLALINGIIDGTIDMIATDHAPHSKEEKSKGLVGSLMGIVGFETAFPILYTNLVKKGIITLEHLIKVMHDNPLKRFNKGSNIKVGEAADFTVFNLDTKYSINKETFLTKGRATPYENVEVYGDCVLTVAGGNIAWQKQHL